MIHLQILSRMELSKFIWIFLVFVALRVKVNSTYTIKKNLYNYISIFFSKYCSLVYLDNDFTYLSVGAVS